MNPMLIIFISIVSIFFLALIFKQFLEKRKQENFCTICLAISLTWLIFLIASWLNIFSNKIILAILMGQSSLAIFYILDKKPRLQFFKLPLLLVLIIIPYALISGDIKEVLPSALLIASLSIVFLFIFSIKSKALGPFIKKVVECCKRW